MSMSDIAEGFIKNSEKTFGAAHPTRERVKSARRIVVKVQPSFEFCISDTAPVHCMINRWAQSQMPFRLGQLL